VSNYRATQHRSVDDYDDQHRAKVRSRPSPPLLSALAIACWKRPWCCASAPSRSGPVIEYNSHLLRVMFHEPAAIDELWSLDAGKKSVNRDVWRTGSEHGEVVTAHGRNHP